MAARKKSRTQKKPDWRAWLKARWFPVAVTGLVLLGAAARIYGAWAFRFITDGDSGIVGLMARHMAQGEPWPVFFYGQAYMGSFEPLVSAFTCKLFGINGFAVCLGSALLAVAALVPLALWARGAGGRTAAFVALALCVVGPRAYYLFQFAPRGGYTAALFCGTWVMFYGSRMAGWAWNRDQVGAGSFLLLGFVAGLGWWSNPIVTPALVATALVLLIGMRGRFWTRPVWAGLAGFLVGSAPFWYWNFTHDWASFGLLANVGTRSMAEGAELIWPRLMSLATPDHWPAGLRATVVVLYLVPAAWGLVAGCMQMRKGWNPGFTCAVLFVALSLIVFARSDYAGMNTARYLLPLVPALSLLGGVAVQHTAMPWRVAFVAVVSVLIVFQWPAVGEAAEKSRDAGPRRERAEELAAFLEESGIEAAYCHFSHHALNFMLEERWAFSDMRSERYRPIAQRAELAERVAVLDNFGPVADFLAISGGRADHTRVGGLRVEHGFEPPPAGLKQIDASLVTALTDGRGNDLAPALQDLNEDTSWEHHGGDPDRDLLEVRFAAPQPLRAIRLLGPPGSTYPAIGRVDVRRPGRADWETVLEDHVVPAFFWSGPRPFWSLDRVRLEYRFDDRPVEAVRLAPPPPTGGRRGAWRVSECGLFVADEEPPAIDDAWKVLTVRLWDDPLERLYCPRWVANRIRANGEMEVEVPLYPVAFPGEGLPAVMDLTIRTGVLVPRYEASATRRVLDRHGAAYGETPVARWVLFTLEAKTEGGAVPVSPVVWTGSGLVTGNGQAHAGALLAKARALVAADEPGAVAATLNEAYTVYPGALTAAADLLEWIRKEDAAALSPALAAAGSQLEKCLWDTPVTYREGIELAGLCLRPSRVAPGGTARLSYVWRYPRRGDPRDLAVFVHLRRGDVVIQDDHVLLEAVDLTRLEAQLPGELFIEDRAVVIPHDAPAGRYELAVGLYLRSSERRLTPHTDLPSLDQAVVISEVMEVGEGRENDER